MIRLQPFLGEGDEISTTMRFLLDNEVSEISSDLSKVVFPDNVPAKPDITKFFVSEVTLKSCN